MCRQAGSSRGGLAGDLLFSGLYLGLCRLLRDGCVVLRPHPPRSGDPKSARSPECLKDGAGTVADFFFFFKIFLEYGRRS